MDLPEALSQLDKLKGMLPALTAALQGAAVDKAISEGGAVVVRPVTFRQPVKGETDPWFGLSYADWKRYRLKEGFDGWMVAGDSRKDQSAGGRAAVILIFTERAAAWLDARRAGQRASGAPGAGDEDRG